MPNLTTPFLRLSGDTEQDLKQIEQWSVALVDELKSVLCNLDSGNVGEAASVKAQNIDCTKAKIKDAQVQSMTADKLTAGTINVSEGISITGSHDDKTTGDYGSMNITNETIEMYERGNLRIAIGRDEDGHYIFTVQSRDGNSGIYMKEDGNNSVVYLTGALTTTKDCSVGTSLSVGIGADAVINFMGPSNQPEAKIGIFSSDGVSGDHTLTLEARDGVYIKSEGGVYINGRLIE